MCKLLRWNYYGGQLDAFPEAARRYSVKGGRQKHAFQHIAIKKHELAYASHHMDNIIDKFKLVERHYTRCEDYRAEKGNTSWHGYV